MQFCRPMNHLRGLTFAGGKQALINGKNSRVPLRLIPKKNGDYDVEITVPADHIVASTGQLQNPENVLTKKQRKRLNEASKSLQTESTSF